MIAPIVNTPSFGDFSRIRPSLEQLQQRGITSGSRNTAQSKQQLLPLNALRLSEITPAGQVAKSIEEQLFDRAVQLKVQLSQYAMHLSADDRSRTFDEIDRLLDVEDWYEEDTLPTSIAFQDFVKWAICTGEYRWTSMGISESGSILVAWRVGSSIMTANFGGTGSVRWTVKLGVEGDQSNIVGQSTLTDFTTQSKFYFSEMRARQKA